MTESEVCALLDAHDALVRACVDESLSFAEFLAAYGNFPGNYALDSKMPMRRCAMSCDFSVGALRSTHGLRGFCLG